MAIGRPLTKDDANLAAANLAGQVFSVTDNIKKFQAVMDGLTADDLVALGFALPDANSLKSALADLGEVADFFRGGTPGAARDRRTFARKLLGTGIY